ncbi:MAG: UPF0175 family protein [Nanoarchaeota archaeon]
MYKTKFLGLRMEKEIYDIIDKVTHEEKLDKTSAIKILIQEGWKELRLKKALNEYQNGLVSVDRASKIAGLTISEMMKEIASHGIKSDETLEEYRKGIKILQKLEAR